MTLPIDYVLQFDARRNHCVDITLHAPVPRAKSVELMMPVWTPGSYMVREYARHVEQFNACSVMGQELGVTKVRKNRWRIAGHDGTIIRVTYRVYCREMTVRTNWIEEDFALLNGASTFMTLADSEVRAHHVRIVMPATWKHVATGLTNHQDASPFHYTAANFDELVDSPLLCGNLSVSHFDVQGKSHSLATVGDAGLWDFKRVVADVQRIVEQNAHLWGQLPYPNYTFLNVLCETRGGLEHANSTVLMASRWAFRDREAYVDWLGLVSHEFFHAWNVKRLRPVELGPFDYENEVYTPCLWVAEGMTAYYDDLMVRRSGLANDQEYLERLSRNVADVQNAPGRQLQSLAQGSFDAWIKFYRRDENTQNTAVSYYAKGALVAWLLDMRLRAASDDKVTLDHVMRHAYALYSGPRGFSTEEFLDVVLKVSQSADTVAWLDAVVHGTEELSFDAACSWLGLRFKVAPEPVTAVWLGLDVKNEGGRLVIARVLRDGPAYQQGLCVDDEIIAINDLRVPAGRWDERLKQYRLEDTAQMLISRREQLMRLPIKWAPAPDPKRWQLEIRPDATALQKGRLENWWKSCIMKG